MVEEKVAPKVSKGPHDKKVDLDDDSCNHSEAALSMKTSNNDDDENKVTLMIKDAFLKP